MRRNGHNRTPTDVGERDSELDQFAETLSALEELNKGPLVDGDDVLDWLDSWGTEDEKEAPAK